MVDAARYWSFVAVAVALVLVPGPSVLFVISRSVAYGRAAGFRTVLGNAAGAGTQVLLISLGLGTLLARSATAFAVLKLAGAGYLVWLGWHTWRDRGSLAGLLDRSTGRPAGRMLAEGYVVGLTNPKLFVFFAAVLPQFVDRRAGGVAGQIAVLGLTFVAIALVCDSAWAVAAGSARAWLARSPRRLAAVGGAGGLVTIGLGVGVAFTGRRD